MLNVLNTNLNSETATLNHILGLAPWNNVQANILISIALLTATFFF